MADITNVGAEQNWPAPSRLLVISVGLTGLFLLSYMLHWEVLSFFQLFVAVCTAFFVFLLCFSCCVVFRGIREDSMIRVSKQDVVDLQEVVAKDKSIPLPRIVILAALYKEAKIVKQLVHNLSQLKYPKGYSSVVIVLEQDDTATITAFQQVDLPSNFSVVIRPSGGIGTKPGALNYALDQGCVNESDITVVFDAEDQPDPFQLYKVAIAFSKAKEEDPNVVCLQGRLTFDQNVNTNWLTRMLGLDYLQHFGVMLPGLSSLGLISPLGGTTNYILTQTLLALRWDASNVTEDMELAVRIARLGKSIRVFDSVTNEEAVTGIAAFIRQRSRWNKGAIQTYQKHMSHPIELFNQLGWKKFISFQLIVGAPLVLYMVNPIFWTLSIAFAVTHSLAIQSLYPPLVFYMASISFVGGNLAYIYFLLMAAFKTKHFSLVIFGLFAPLYWVLLSIAGYRAFSEYFGSAESAAKWQKTEHLGMSSISGD